MHVQLMWMVEWPDDIKERTAVHNDQVMRRM